MKRMTAFHMVLGMVLSTVFAIAYPPLASAQWGQGYGGWGRGPGMMYGWGGGMGWVGMVMMIAFWVLVIVALVFLIRWLMQGSRGQAGARPSGSNALDILMERYARGEIDKNEFEAKKQDLTR